MARTRTRVAAVVGAALLGAWAPPLRAQDSAAAPEPPAPLFATQEPLALTLVADLGRLRRDKEDKAPWRPVTIEYPGADGRAVSVPAKARTRGIWRLKNCSFPPLRLNFAGATARGTVFERLDKPKMVNYCRDTRGYDQYVLQELQLYRAFALLTPMSHLTRLARVTYVDAATRKPHTTRHAILLEEPEALARRVGGRVIDIKGAGARDLDQYHAALVGVFQYFIGNSDWSTASLHNAELVSDASLSIFLVPYDFDFAGAVDAPYATPDPKLPIKRVRERIYRGHCAPPEDYARVFALFNEKKDAIYALYRDEIGRLIEPRTVRETLAYFDEFYATINTPNRARHNVIAACNEWQ